ncbi:hypothetical protein LJC61_02720 [Ruminococcaceae bacterium OttesenSCG-928-A16]|nr:hypothetical protein [Ruminococcaceae bacterium OttesenSCG-928-A16]
MNAGRLTEELNKRAVKLNIPGEFILNKEDKVIVCPYCSIIVGEEQYTLVSNGGVWLAIIIAVFVDIITGASEDKRNYCLKRLGLWDGSFRKGKKYILENEWECKVFSGGIASLTFQILRKAPPTK